jgi:hypothetical protein
MTVSKEIDDKAFWAEFDCAAIESAHENYMLEIIDGLVIEDWTAEK